MVEESLEVVETNQKRRFGWAAALILLVALGAIWMLVRPGVFTVQPIGALPDGATVVYIGRSPQMPFFSSPDSICLEIQGSVSLLCRAMAFAAVDEITDSIVLRLGYSEWAYLASTGGRTFE